MKAVKEYYGDLRILMQSVPSMTITIFVLSVVLMNLLAGRELYRSDYFCLNTGLALSWISFLCMDCICKRFGAKAAMQVSIAAITVNMICAVIFYLLMLTPGRWAAYYSATEDMTGRMITAGIDSTFSSAWYIVAGSSAAMLSGTIVNALLNQMIGSRVDHGNYSGFAARSLFSTCAAQFVDNFVFSAMVSHVFFGWNWMQVIVCSFTSMLIELGLEAVFSPVGYKIAKGWEENHVGELYIKMQKAA